MSFKNVARHTVQSGKLIPFYVDGIVVPAGGARPTLWLEHYGSSNATAVSEAITEAGTEQPDLRDTSPAGLELQWRKTRDALARHIVRKVDGFYHDGPDGEPNLEHPAGVEDIPEIVESLPYNTCHDAFMAAINADNYRIAPLPDVGELAKK